MVSRIAVFGSSGPVGIAVVHYLTTKYPGVQIVAGTVPPMTFFFSPSPRAC